MITSLKVKEGKAREKGKESLREKGREEMERDRKGRKGVEGYFKDQADKKNENNNKKKTNSD